MTHLSTTLGNMQLEARARLSLGSSHDAIYRMVGRELAARKVTHAHLLDIGCGSGALLGAVRTHVSSYTGVDAVRYDGFPETGEFIQVDLDAATWPLPEANADVVTAVEVIEHLENPWAFMRRIAALVKPRGLVCITTPNQLSVLSMLTLASKKRHSAFQDSHYPAHRTALLESDLCRAAVAASLEPLKIVYSRHGRLPLSRLHYPAPLPQLLPRALSDNLMLVAQRPARS